MLCHNTHLLIYNKFCLEFVWRKFCDTRLGKFLVRLRLLGSGFWAGFGFWGQAFGEQTFGGRLLIDFWGQIFGNRLLGTGFWVQAFWYRLLFQVLAQFWG